MAEATAPWTVRAAGPRRTAIRSIAGLADIRSAAPAQGATATTSTATISSYTSLGLLPNVAVRGPTSRIAVAYCFYCVRRDCAPFPEWLSNRSFT